MQHPETMLQLVQQRQAGFQAEANRDRLIRESRVAAHQERRERFSVRDLRMLLLRPSGA